MGTAAVAMMAGSAILGAAGTLAQGKAEEQAARYNAQLAEIEGRQRESAIRKRGRSDIGAIRANIGKAGVTTAGSPMEVLAESAANIEMDALNARFNMQTEAAALRAEGKSRRRASQISAAAQLLSGGSQTFSTGKQLGVFK